MSRKDREGRAKLIKTEPETVSVLLHAALQYSDLAREALAVAYYGDTYTAFEEARRYFDMASSIVAWASEVCDETP